MLNFTKKVYQFFKLINNFLMSFLSASLELWIQRIMLNLVQCLKCSIRTLNMSWQSSVYSLKILTWYSFFQELIYIYTNSYTLLKIKMFLIYWIRFSFKCFSTITITWLVSISKNHLSKWLTTGIETIYCWFVW